MLKFTKGLFAVVGLAAAVTTATFIARLFSQVDELVAAAQGSGVTLAGGPKRLIWIAVGASALAGLFLGMGMALPRRTARSIRNETRARTPTPTPAAASDPDTGDE